MYSILSQYIKAKISNISDLSGLGKIMGLKGEYRGSVVSSSGGRADAIHVSPQLFFSFVTDFSYTNFVN